MLWDFKKAGDKWVGGKILDPGNGSTYSSSLWLLDEDTLKVRGYLGPFYRSQVWKRVKSQVRTQCTFYLGLCLHRLKSNIVKLACGDTSQGMKTYYHSMSDLVKVFRYLRFAQQLIIIRFVVKGIRNIRNVEIYFSNQMIK